ncbi:MAG: GHKL domain-containing protein [Terriglobus roseus]|nr:GHKL domain-containing protein [Terriglobus roseus]
MEGGFYAAQANVLTGYAFPTHEGPGGVGEVPGKERPEIEELARKATRTGALQTQNFHGAYDAILFVAAPVRDGKKIVGAAWLMQRMPGLESGRSKQLLLGSVGFTAAAIVCGFLTFFITKEVSNGVQTVLARLGTMEGALGEHPEKAKPQLREFELVLNRVDALSDSLKQQIETQRALEDEVRHRQRLSALGQFAAGVAHELRNPLATIRLRAQMSQRTRDSGAVERNSTVVLNEVDRLDKMIERLLYFSRPIRLQLDRVALRELCSLIMETWQERCKVDGVDLTCCASEDLIVICDRSKVRQVLDNVLENALHSVLSVTREHPRIELHGQRDGDRVLLQVRDNGVGLNPDARTHALEPFFTTKDTGTGLGLSISYEIMQAHGGDLQLHNLPADGAVATLSMPAADAASAGSVLASL